MEHLVDPAVDGGDIHVTATSVDIASSVWDDDLSISWGWGIEAGRFLANRIDEGIVRAAMGAPDEGEWKFPVLLKGDE